jgi:branched-chain amino acid transport system substrate-binding protein
MNTANRHSTTRFGNDKRGKMGITRYKFWAWAAAVSLGVVLLAACQKSPPPFECTDRIGCLEIRPGDPIKFGVLQALSGKVAPLGREQIRGIELSLRERKGRLLGRPVSLRIEDTGCTAAGGANAALKIIADPETVAILGTTCSGAAATAAKAMSDAGLTMISGNNSAPFLTAIGGKRAPHWQPGYFRTAANEETAGRAAAIYAFQEMGLRKAATINDGDIYTRGLTLGFENAFELRGGTIVLSTAVNKGDEEMGPVLTAVRNAGAELIFFPLFQPEGNHVVRQTRDMAGFREIVMMSDGALIESSFIDDVGRDAVGMYFVGPSRPRGPVVDRLVRAYLAEYGEEPSASYFLSAYDAANLLMDAVEKTALREPDGTLHIGRQALRDALYVAREVEGATGTLACNEFGDCARPVFDVLRLDDPSAGLEGLQSNVMFTYGPSE